MHLQESRRCDYQKRREAVLDAVVGYGYLAPGRLAMDEQRERMIAEGVHKRLMVTADSADARQSLQQSVRSRLKEVLVSVGVDLRRWYASGVEMVALRKIRAG